jgi:hypothetical protein
MLPCWRKSGASGLSRFAHKISKDRRFGDFLPANCVELKVRNRRFAGVKNTQIQSFEPLDLFQNLVFLNKFCEKMQNLMDESDEFLWVIKQVYWFLQIESN